MQVEVPIALNPVAEKRGLRNSGWTTAKKKARHSSGFL